MSFPKKKKGGGGGRDHPRWARGLFSTQIAKCTRGSENDEESNREEEKGDE